MDATTLSKNTGLAAITHNDHLRLRYWCKGTGSAFPGRKKEQISMNMSATFDLFEGMVQGQIRREELCPGAVLLRGFAAENEAAIFAELPGVTAQALFATWSHPVVFACRSQ